MYGDATRGGSQHGAGDEVYGDAARGSPHGGAGGDAQHDGALHGQDGDAFFCARTKKNTGSQRNHATSLNLSQKKKNGNMYCIRLLMGLTGVQHALSTNTHTLHESALGRMLHWMIKMPSTLQLLQM